MSPTFIVCWVLMFQPVAYQENCTPDLPLPKAQLIMSYVVDAGNYLDVTIRPTPPGPPPAPPIHVSPPGEKSQ